MADDNNVLFSFNLDTTGFNQKLVETLDKLNQVKITVDNSSKSLDAQKDRYNATISVINNHNKYLQNEIDFTKEVIRINNDKIKTLSQENKALGDINESNKQKRTDILDEIKLLKQANQDQTTYISSINSTIKANKDNITEIKNKATLLKEQIKTTKDQEKANQDLIDSENKKTQQIKTNIATQLLFTAQVKQLVDEKTKEEIRLSQESTQKELDNNKAKLASALFYYSQIKTLAENVKQAKRDEKQQVLDTSENKRLEQLKQNALLQILFTNQAKQVIEENTKAEIKQDQEKTSKSLDLLKSRLGATLYFYQQAKIYGDNYNKQEQDNFQKNLDAFYKSEEKKAEIKQKALTKQTVQEGKQDLDNLTNQALANQKKQREDLAEAKRKDIQETNNSIQANQFEMKALKDKIALISETYIGKKKLTDQEKAHNEEVSKLLQPLQAELKLLKEKDTQLQLQKASLNGNQISINNTNNALQNNVKTLVDNKKAIEDNTKKTDDSNQAHQNFRNTIWELVYAFRGLEMGVKTMMGLTLGEFTREFDKNLHNTDSILLTTSENFRVMKERLLEISKEDSYSSLPQLSDAMYHAVSAGFNLAESLNLVKEADRGAMAGLAETADVLKALVSVTHSYGKGTYDAAKVNDILLKTVQEGVITMPELVRHIGQATTIAPELGIAFEDVAGAMVAMTRQGLNASESVTALNQVFKVFLDPSKEATMYAEALGINLNKTAFEGRNLADVVKEIASKADTDLIGKLFGNIRGIKGFFKLAKDEGDLFATYIQHQHEAMGAVQKSGERQAEAYDRRLKEVKASWEIFTQGIGEDTAKNITPILRFFNDLLRSINELPDPLKKLLAIVIEFGFVMGGFAIATAGGIAGLKALGVVALEDVTAITLLKGAVGLLSAELTLLASNPLMIAGMATLGAGIYTSYQGIQAIKAQNQANETNKYNQDIINESRKKVSQFQTLREQGTPLTTQQKAEYAHALITSGTPEDENYKAKRELANLLMEEVKAVQKAEQDKVDIKDKMSKLEADKLIKTRKDFLDNEKKLEDDIKKSSETEGQTKVRHVKEDYDKQIAIAKNAYEKLRVESDQNGLKEDAFTKERQEKAKNAIVALEKAKILEVARVQAEEDDKAKNKREAQLKRDSERAYKSGGYDKSLADLNTQEKQAQLGFTKTGDEEKLNSQLENIEQKRVKVFQNIVNNNKLLKEVRDQAQNSLIDSQIKLEQIQIKITDDTIERERKKYNNNLKLSKDESKIKFDTLDVIDFKEVVINEKRLKDIDEDLKRTHLSKKTKESLEFEKMQLILKNSDLINNKEEIKFKRDQEIYKNELDLIKAQHNEKIALGKVSLETKLQYAREELNNLIESKQSELIFYKKDADKKRKIEQELNLLRIKEANLSNTNAIALIQKQESLDTEFYNKRLQMLDNFNKLRMGNDISYLQNKLSIESDYLEQIKAQEEKVRSDNRWTNDRGELTEEAKKIRDKRIQIENEIAVVKFSIYENEIKQEDELQKHRMDNLNSYVKMLGDLGSKLQSSKNFGNIGDLFSTSSKDAENLLGKLNPLRQQILSFSELGSNLEKIQKEQKNQSDLSQIYINDDLIKEAKAKAKALGESAKGVTADMSKLKGEITDIAIQAGIQELINSFGKALEVTDKASLSMEHYSTVVSRFGKDSELARQSQKDFLADQLEMIRIIPFLGDSLSKLSRLITDSTGLTTSEAKKKENENILKLQHDLAVQSINIQKESTDNKIALENENYKYSVEQLNKEILTKDEYALKSEYLEKDHQNNLLKIIQDGTSKALDIELSYQESLMSSSQNSYENKQKTLKMKFDNDLLKLLQQMPSDSEGITLWLKQTQTLINNFNKDKLSLEIDNQNKTRELRLQFLNSEINLLNDGSSKQLAIAENKKDNSLAILEDEQQKDLYTLEQYQLKQQTILNEYQLDKNKVFHDLYVKMYSDQTAKLKSEYQKQLDIINNFEQAKQDLIEGRQQDASAKKKRADQMKIDLAVAREKANNTIGFFTSNQLDFEIGNGLDTGNETLRNKATQQFAQGIISYQEMIDKKKQLSLEKQIYYEQQLALYKDPEKRQAIQAKINEAINEYYDNVFDKEQEKLNTDKANAEKKIKILEQQILEQQNIEGRFIEFMNKKYKDSAEIWASEMKKGTVEWITFTQANLDVLFSQVSKGQIPNTSFKDNNSLSVINANVDTNKYNPLTQVDVDNINAPLPKNNNSPPNTVPMYIPLVGWVDMPLHAKGGVTKGMSIAGERGSEAIFNYSQMQKMYDYMLNTSNTGNSQQNIVYSPNISINGVQLQSDSNIINIATQISNNQIKELKNNLSNNQYSRR